MSAKGLGAPKPPDMSDPDLKDAIDLAKRLARTREVTTEGMDEMANRIFNEINREIERLEESKQDADFQERAADARSLAQLQRTLTEAIRLRRDRILASYTDITQDHLVVIQEKSHADELRTVANVKP